MSSIVEALRESLSTGEVQKLKCVFFPRADALIHAKSPEVFATFRGSDGEK